MTKLTTLDLSPFYRASVGLDRLFDQLTSDYSYQANNGYPPHDIIRTGEDAYEIHLAIAGFEEGEVEVEFHDGQLRITGKRDRNTEDGSEYLHRGISGRSFEKSFTLADYVEVKGASTRNGILRIQLERVVPESMKPKNIAITYEG